MLVQIDEHGIPRVTNKPELRVKARELFGEEAAGNFRERVRKLLRADRYRKSASRELSWGIMAAMILLVEEAKLFRDERRAADDQHNRDLLEEVRNMDV